MFKIALLQMTSHGADQAANLSKGEDFCRRAKALEADLALFPEMWNIGYTFFDRDEPGARERWAAQVSGPIKIGAMICFDREFPETALYPSGCPALILNSTSIMERA